MRIHAFSVFDSAAKLFMQPFFARTRGEAMRSFMDACSDEKHQFSRHAMDYSLYVVGQFDEDDGLLIPQAEPERLMSALDVKRGNESRE